MRLPEISNLFFIKINPRLQNPLFRANHIQAPASCLWLLGDNLLAYYRCTSFQHAQGLYSFHTLIHKNTKVYLLQVVKITIHCQCLCINCHKQHKFLHFSYAVLQLIKLTL